MREEEIVALKHCRTFSVRNRGERRETTLYLVFEPGISRMRVSFLNRVCCHAAELGTAQ